MAVLPTPPQLLRARARGNSLSTVPPAIDSAEYNHELAEVALRIVYRSPLPSQDGLPVYVLNSAALPDASAVSYDQLLPYVLARLPSEEALIGGQGYELIFFAGGGDEAVATKSTAPSAQATDDDAAPTQRRRNRPNLTWIVQAYNLLPRPLRKRLQKLYLVHERRWVRLLTEMFSTIVSPKFRRKVFHATTLQALAAYMPIEDLLIPPAAYNRDRQLARTVGTGPGRRSFGAVRPLPISVNGKKRLPRILRETTNFLLAGDNAQNEGLFRVSARATTLEILEEAYDRGQKFIVWRELQTSTTFPVWRVGLGEVNVQDPNVVVGYGVHTAAGLIKHWYAALREPLFTPDAYPYLQRRFGQSTTPITMEDLLDVVLETAEASPIRANARSIMTMHLLPLLAHIAATDGNKMDARALAVVFAPSLMRGPDPLEDAKMSMTIIRILEAAIKEWPGGLSAFHNAEEARFEALLELPHAPDDREDMLDKHASTHDAPWLGEQRAGIVKLEESESEADEEELAPPPLPPRHVEEGEERPEEKMSPVPLPDEATQIHDESEEADIATATTARESDVATSSLPAINASAIESESTAAAPVKRKPAPILGKTSQSFGMRDGEVSPTGIEERLHTIDLNDDGRHLTDSTHGTHTSDVTSSPPPIHTPQTPCSMGPEAPATEETTAEIREKHSST